MLGPGQGLAFAAAQGGLQVEAAAFEDLDLGLDPQASLHPRVPEVAGQPGQGPAVEEARGGRPSGAVGRHRLDLHQVGPREAAGLVRREPCGVTPIAGCVVSGPAVVAKEQLRHLLPARVANEAVDAPRLDPLPPLLEVGTQHHRIRRLEGACRRLHPEHGLGLPRHAVARRHAPIAQERVHPAFDGVGPARKTTSPFRHPGRRHGRRDRLGSRALRPCLDAPCEKPQHQAPSPRTATRRGARAGLRTELVQAPSSPRRAARSAARRRATRSPSCPASRPSRRRSTDRWEWPPDRPDRRRCARRRGSRGRHRC